MVIGISGKMGHGKDTIGRMIQYWWARNNNDIPEKVTVEEFVQENSFQLISEFEIKKFAEGVKFVAGYILNVHPIKFEDPQYKLTQLGPEWNRNGEPMTVRMFLQELATDAMRNNLHEDVWVNTLTNKYTENSKWIITDFRFPNELKWLKSQNSKIIRIHNPNIIIKKPEHVSETLFDDYKDFDFFVTNPGTYQGLYKEVEKICKEIF